ncbi:lipoprotein LipL41 [Leptospira langatensis]|uniref:Lipoprotein LipL41 n=1 Tax=Leptospira langatensis TaxID=2484983 RepID=A0A5F1ZR67_9LEPT|nr:lipoprotein LipL41 [Leptospira langatensis]TGK02762.1 lipoprotein LipL41 [Leptospira langatensis]TGL40033.1 lipoprotein LipL41 [Leptospira langatensis]
MRRNLLYIFIACFIYASCRSVRVEYPYYPQTKEGRELRVFLKGVRNVGLAVEPPKSDVWMEDYDVSRSFLAVVPEKIFEAFSNDSYFKLIDLSKRADILNEQTFSLTGITQNRIEMGKLLGAEAILYISVARPVSECTIEMRADYWAMGVQALQVAAAVNQNRRYRSYGPVYGAPQSQPVMRPTGVRRILLPIEASLVRVDTGEMKKAVITKPVVVDNGAGDTNCPAMLDSLSKALDETIPEIEARLSPRVKSENVSIFIKDEDPEIESYLTEGYEEIKGETPSFQRAKAAWEKADQKAKGKSWAAKANLATYYFSQGDFEKASELYDQAVKLGGPEESYLIDLRKLSSSAAEAIE